MMFRVFTRTTPVQHLWRDGAREAKLNSCPRAQFRHSAVFLQSGNSRKCPSSISKEPGKGKSSRDATKIEFFDMSLSTEIAVKKRGNAAKASKTDKGAPKIGFFDMSLPREVASPKERKVQRSQQGSSVDKKLEKTGASKNGQAGKIEYFSMSLSREIATSEPKAQKIPTVSKKLVKVTDKQATKTKFFDTSLPVEVVVKCRVSAKTDRKDQKALLKDFQKRTEENNGEKSKKLDSRNDSTSSSATASSSLIAATPPKLDLEPLSNPTLDYFHTRLRQMLLYFYFLLHTENLSASPEVKHFLINTPFLTVYRLISSAVLPSTKYLINSGRIDDYTLLPKDCLVTNQGCYMNVITQPDAPFSVYIGGSGSITRRPKAVKRPLQGRLSDPPHTEKLAGGSSAGVGRRVAQHLAMAGRKSSTTPHYKCMQEEGSRYDFRLLAAFPEIVETGAVWVLESFLVRELGTIPVKGETGVVRYKGLNRRDPLTTSVTPSKVVLGEDGKKRKVPVYAGLEHQTKIDVATLSWFSERESGMMARV